jgi:plasmid stability protein
MISIELLPARGVARLIVRDLGEAVKEKRKRHAKRHGRSMESGDTGRRRQGQSGGEGLNRAVLSRLMTVF